MQDIVTSYAIYTLSERTKDTFLMSTEESMLSINYLLTPPNHNCKLVSLKDDKTHQG